LFAPNIISSNLQSSGSVRPFKLAPSTGPNTEGENHNIWTGGGGANALMNKDHWEEALKFGESTGTSGWFIDAAPFASIQDSTGYDEWDVPYVESIILDQPGAGIKTTRTEFDGGWQL
jgi:hypothetical protein